VCVSPANGAYARGISEKLGTLEETKQADIVLMDVSDYRELSYYFGVNHCVITIKKGNSVISHLEQH
jgi:imidazolonepropionase